ncbi:MAG TPA: PepSY-associated TM helix domain-containing protein [Azospirillaceae bacterium]|nr:PepSY-associated TM helix domain-containing protein [Azospirillaceae bacterium]
MARRDWFRWHSWTGLTAGLLLFVFCWSGTVAVFSREIDWLLNAAIRAAPVEGELPWGRAEAAIAEARPGWTLVQLNAPYAPGWAMEAWLEDPHGVMHRAYADPRSGEVVAVTPYFNVQRFFRSFHMALFIVDWRVGGVPLGYWLVGIMAVALLGSLVTSLVFYKRWWRGFLKLERGKGAKVLWSDLHKLAGVWSLWFVALIGLTGIWYLAEWYTPRSPAPPERPAVAAQAVEAPGIDALVAAARATLPGLQVRAVLPGEVVEVQGRDGALLVRDRAAKVWLDPRDGGVLGVQRASDLTAYQRWIDTADPVHFGDFGGLWSKAVWFFFGLGLSSLCLSGAYLQAQRQRRAHPGLRTPVLAAYAVTVAALLASAWCGVGEIRGYGRVEGGAPGWPEAAAGVWLFVGAWIAVTLAALTAWMAKLR